MIKDTAVVLAKSIVSRRSCNRCIVAARADFDPHDRVVSSSRKKKGLPVMPIVSIVRNALLTVSKGQGVTSLFLAVDTVRVCSERGERGL
jgi:hypothetical protein